MLEGKRTGRFSFSEIIACWNVPLSFTTRHAKINLANKVGKKLFLMGETTLL